MSILLTIIAVIVIFSVLVLIHEYGHFIAARASGIKVLEFGIGFPPRIFKKKIGETIYSINLIPFGGFVKLFGEDASNEAMLKHRRSFSNKSPWIRTKVISAGVLMNFLLAIALLTIGFSFGIEPLLVTEQDLFFHLSEGNVKTSPGIFIAKVSDQVKSLGILPGDKILAINDRALRPSSLNIFQKGKATSDIDLTLGRHGEVQKIHLPFLSPKSSFGIELKPFTEFPRLTVSDIKSASAIARAGVQAGDTILQMNGKEIYSLADFENILSESGSVIFTLLRGSEILTISLNLPDTKRILVSDVFPESAAQKADFQKGDIILSIDGMMVSRPEQVQEILKKNPGRAMNYRLYRGGREITLLAKASSKNVLGIALSVIHSYHNREMSLYRDSILTSITEIRKVRFHPWKALQQAFSESFRLTGLTVEAFGRTLKSLISEFTVPEIVGGPVQIAYYTHAFIQEGFFALLRFTALLSLSLGVLNVLPIPALDGGRLFFILIEVILKKRVNARFEFLIHGIGFFLLLVLIIAVTYSDITKLF